MQGYGSSPGRVNVVKGSATSRQPQKSPNGPVSTMGSARTSPAQPGKTATVAQRPPVSPNMAAAGRGPATGLIGRGMASTPPVRPEKPGHIIVTGHYRKLPTTKGFNGK